MTTIINGRKYDTENSTLCGIHKPYQGQSTLYRQDRDTFFLVSESVQIFKSLCDYGKGTRIRTLSDVSITPINLPRALAWAAENLSPEDYEKIVDNTDNYN